VPLMLDSGAFSVWNSGAEIDIRTYIDFCHQHPGVSYYVCLDAIPGKPGLPNSRLPELVAAACETSWNNYQLMIKELPIEKVIPVFHRGEDLKWLERYIEFGSPYVGLGQTCGFGSKDSQKRYLTGLQKLLFDGAGRPTVKTHGFAVTSFQLMKYQWWYSVDSASWLKQAAYGVIYIPKKRNGEFVYDEPPFLLNTSPKSPTRDERNTHYTTLSPTLRAWVDEYLQEKKLPVGEIEIVDVSSGYKKSPDELWFDGKKNKVVRTVTPGVVTSHQWRFRANAGFIIRANQDLPVDHIYFAGGEGSIDDSVEFRLRRRLMSYHKIGMTTTTKGHKAFRKWTEIAPKQKIEPSGSMLTSTSS